MWLIINPHSLPQLNTFSRVSVIHPASRINNFSSWSGYLLIPCVILSVIWLSRKTFMSLIGFLCSCKSVSTFPLCYTLMYIWSMPLYQDFVSWSTDTLVRVWTVISPCSGEVVIVSSCRSIICSQDPSRVPSYSPGHRWNEKPSGDPLFLGLSIIGWSFGVIFGHGRTVSVLCLESFYVIEFLLFRFIRWRVVTEQNPVSHTLAVGPERIRVWL